MAAAIGRRPARGRTMLAAVFFAALLAMPAVAQPGGDFAAGVKAYEAGDYAAAAAAWTPLAEGGDVAAMRNLGHLYRWGQGVTQNVDTAMDWYRRAAEAGFDRAQTNLAAIYLQGDGGVPVNYDEALKWFAAAARQGNPVAQYNLGLMYELGLGVDKSEALALGWYNNAAKAGQPEALERLSQLVLKREPPKAADLQSAGPESAEPESASAEPESGPPPAAAADRADAPAAPEPPKVAPAESRPETRAEPQAAAATEPPAAPEPPAAAPVADPVPETADAPAAAEEADGGGSLLGRFYSAIVSGGGVSLPDLVAPGDDKPAADPE